MRQYIKDFYNVIMGYIEDDLQGNKIAKDYFGKILGYYDKTRDCTQNKFRQVIAQGDCLSGLILQNFQEKKNQNKGK